MALRSAKRMGRNQFAFYAQSEIRNLSEDRRQRWTRLARNIDPEISPNLLHISQHTLLPLLSYCKNENPESFLERHGVNVNFKSNNHELGAVLAEETRRLLEKLKSKKPKPERLIDQKSEKTSYNRITCWGDIPDSVDVADKCAFEFEGVRLITHFLDWIEKHKPLERFKNSGFLMSAVWDLNCELSDQIIAYNNKPTTKTQFRKILSNDALYVALKQ